MDALLSQAKSWIAVAAFIAITSCSPQAIAAVAADTARTVCAGCHGQRGEGSASGAARLAGQDAAYLENALRLFKAGSRRSPIMGPIAANLSESDMRGLAEYFAGLRVPLASSAATPTGDEFLAGKRLFEQGAAGIPACIGCHAPSAAGSASIPTVSGQPSKFVVDRLHEFQARALAAPARPGSMTAVAAAMTELQIRQAASYLSRQVP